MLHPSYTDLINAVNSDVEPGEQPVVQSRYSIVLAASKRARQIIGGDDPLVAAAPGKKPLSIAVQELYEGRVKILGDVESEEDEEETREEYLELEKNTATLSYIDESAVRAAEDASNVVLEMATEEAAGLSGEMALKNPAHIGEEE